MILCYLLQVLCYYQYAQPPPARLQIWHRVGLFVLFSLGTAATSQPLPPTEQWQRAQWPQPQPLICHNISLVCFFFGLLHVFIFLLNNYIVLGYITTHDHPCSRKHDTGLILSGLFALRIATTSQPLPPTEWWRSRHHNLYPNHSYPLQHLMSLVCFFFCLLHLFFLFYTEQLYSFRLCYYTWPSPLACKCDVGLVDQIVQTCHLFLDFHRSVLLCIE